MHIKNCRFVTEHANIVSCPEFETCDESPYYHSGVKIIENTFDSQTAIDFRHCKDIVFKNNINSKGLPFLNVFNNCANLEVDE